MWQLKQKLKINNHKNSFDIVSAMKEMPAYSIHIFTPCCLMIPKSTSYCWWKKSCTRYGESTIIYKVLKTSQVVIAGCLPSTVLIWTKHISWCSLPLSPTTLQVVRVKIEEWMSWGYPNGIFKLPIWGDQTMQMLGHFKGFLLNSALFGLVIYWPLLKVCFFEKMLYILVLKVLFRKVVWDQYSKSKYFCEKIVSSEYIRKNFCHTISIKFIFRYSNLSISISNDLLWSNRGMKYVANVSLWTFFQVVHHEQIALYCKISLP